MKKIFVSTTYYGERSSVIKAINGLKKLDISGIELGSNHRLEKSYNFLNEIKFELFSHNYFPPEDKDFVLNVSSNSQTTRNRSIDFIKKSIEFCFEHNVQMYTFHPGFNSEVISPDINGRKFDFKFFKSKDFDTRRNFENLINSVDKILNFSNGSNLKLAIETGGSLTNPLVPLIQTPYELRSFFDTFSLSSTS